MILNLRRKYRMVEKKIKAVGSKAEVFHGTARHTSGGLKKKDLMKHRGRIISRKKHAAGKKAIKHLRSLGYIAKRGTFKLFRKSMVNGRKRRHTRRGGAAGLASDYLLGASNENFTGSKN